MGEEFNQPTNLENSPSHRTWLWLVIVAVIILIIVGGLFLMKNKKPSPEQSQTAAESQSASNSALIKSRGDALFNIECWDILPKSFFEQFMGPKSQYNQKRTGLNDEKEKSITCDVMDMSFTDNAPVSASFEAIYVGDNYNFDPQVILKKMALPSDTSIKKIKENWYEYKSLYKGPAGGDGSQIGNFLLTKNGYVVFTSITTFGNNNYLDTVQKMAESVSSKISTL
jgi:hypothetical protein